MYHLRRVQQQTAHIWVNTQVPPSTEICSSTPITQMTAAAN